MTDPMHPDPGSRAGSLAPKPRRFRWSPRSRLLLEILGVAVALFVAAKLSQHLTTPPSNAAPVWPGSGIALAATLAYGRRVLIGVFIGALVFELQLFTGAPAALEPARALLLASGLGFGAALQALIGARLIQRVLGPRPALARDRDIIRFQLLGGPLACAVSATFSMVLLWHFGVIPPSGLSLSWVTWWVGDSIGVIIFAPLTLMMLYREDWAWRNRLTTVALPMLALFLATIAFYAYAEIKEIQARQLRFNEQVNALHDALGREFSRHLALLDSLTRFFEARDGVSEQEFRTFVGAAVDAHASIQALEWIPRVPAAERGTFERGLPDGGPIRRLSEDGELIPAAERGEYFAIQYIVPRAKNARAFGFDVSSNPVAAEALFRARDSGLPAASSGLRLVQESENEIGIVVYSPVYQGSSPPRDAAQRRAAILGVTAAVFRLQSLIGIALPTLEQGLIAIRLCDQTGPDPSDPTRCKVLYESHHGVFDRLKDSMRAAYPFDMAGRDWLLEYAATPEYLAANTSWAVWVVLTGGLLVTALSGTGLLMLTGRALRREEEVIARTAELRDEVKQRRDAETQLRLVLEGAKLGFWDRDLQSGRYWVNARWLEMLGLASDEVENGRIDWTDRIHPDDKAPTLALIDKHLRGETDREDLEFRMRHRDGHWVWIQSAGAVVSRDPSSGEPLRLCGIHQDVTERKMQQEQMARQAHFDGLTALPNRFLSLDRLSQLLIDANRNREYMAVLFLDLDDFKKVNDTLGHDTGDKLLQQAAERLKAAVRRGDTVGRLGGDEFIVLLGGLRSAADARPVAETLLGQFDDAFRIDNRELVLTASIGIAIYPHDGDTPSELLRNADSAMYHSKDQGRNTYSYFTDEMNRGVSRRLQLEEQMHGALGRDEFQVYYQPKVEIPSGRIVGAEALLRWHNPALGAVSPLEFIPIAEQSGLIVAIGRFVLAEAVARAVHWQRLTGRAFSMAVNLSPRQFRDPKLVDFITKTIDQAGLAAADLELEITEGVLMSGQASITNQLAALSELGVRLAMDDFGTGYSSLSYLRSYPFDVLKIDREFVSDLMRDAGDQALVSASIAMAHGLGLAVVAEGVETPDQLGFLVRQSCDYAQGYLFGRPLPAEKLSDRLTLMVTATPEDEGCYFTTKPGD